MICNVDRSETQAPFMFVAVEKIVFADRRVEEVTRCDPGRIFIVVLSAGGRNSDQPGAELGGKAMVSGDSRKRSGLDAIANETSLELLIGSQFAEIDSRLAIDCDRRTAVDGIAVAVGICHVVARDSAGNLATVEAPVDAHPRRVFSGNLILCVRGLIEALVMVNAERKTADAYGRTCTCDLRGEESRCYRGHYDER